ncbi:MAG: alpha-amylase [Pseudomonadota bacterium]|nr:alpha-amylase [Pseudomonadota bacterium]
MVSEISNLRRSARRAGVAATLAATLVAARASDLTTVNPPPAAPDKAFAAQAPAPLGVFGVGLLDPGHFSLSYAPSWTLLSGNQIGASFVSPQYIIQNAYSNHLPPSPGKYGLLRMVPREFDFIGQGASAAYGLTNNITLVAATVFWDKRVHMDTFHPGTGPSALLGTSIGQTDGIGDTLVAGVWRVYRDNVHQLNVNFGLSLPTGSTTLNQTLLVPSGVEKYARAFYGMQPGTGSFDALPGVSYSGVTGPSSWGLAYRGRFPLGDNSQGWRYGDLNDFTGWGGYSWLPGLETTLRADAMFQDRIHGFDPVITGFAQGANPLFYGGQWLSLFAGLNVAGRYFGAPAASLALEVGAPVYQNLNGPQGARALQVSSALSYKF